MDLSFLCTPVYNVTFIWMDSSLLLILDHAIFFSGFSIVEEALLAAISEKIETASFHL